MSASEKKKLRQQEHAAQMTERQQNEAKEAKKLRTYTIIFTAVIALMICVVIGTTIFESGIFERHTTAATVNGTDIKAVEFNHFYVDAVNNFMNQFGQMIGLTGIDVKAPLDQQIRDEETGETWADYFVETAAESMKNIYAIYNDAMANNFQLSDEANTELEASIAEMDTYAAMQGFPNAGGIIKAIYGRGCDEASYRHYVTVKYIASEYAQQHNDALVYEDADLRAADAENAAKYSAYTFNYYYLAASEFYQGGTTSEEGTVTYSDEEKQAGAEACKAAAESIMDQNIQSVEDLDAAISALEINAESQNVSSHMENALYDDVNSDIREWVVSPDRSEGDITLLPYEREVTDEEGVTSTELSGYYLVYYTSANDNNQPLVNVRHILLGHEGGTTDANGNITYSDEEKAATKQRAEALLAEFTSGDATEEAFASLASEKSTDEGSKSNGGLYEDVFPGQMVPSFNDWCFDETRKAGDTGIVESDFGAHVMYFVGNSETSYRDSMIEQDLRSTDMTDWQQGLVDGLDFAVVNTSKVRTDMIIAKG